MARKSREKSKTGIYHIIIRGVNRQTICCDDRDRERLCQTLFKYQSNSDFDIFGYCIMSNHIHLLIKENLECISDIVKKISSSYVFWFNSRYERSGHLFQERYKSEIVENDSYFLTALRYIHQNPVKAGITEFARDYKWSSFNEYISGSTVINTEYPLSYYGKDRNQAIEQFKLFTEYETDKKFIDCEERTHTRDEDVEEHFKKQGLCDVGKFYKLGNKVRNEILKQAKVTLGTSSRQISRVTGLSTSLVCRAVR